MSDETKKIINKIVVGVVITSVSTSLITTTGAVLGMKSSLEAHIVKAEIFMDPGSRFTTKDGALLAAELNRVSKEVEELSLSDKELYKELDKVKERIYSRSKVTKNKLATIEDNKNESRN